MLPSVKLPVGEIARLLRDFPPQPPLPSNLQMLNLMLVNLFIILFIMLVHCISLCVWQK